MAKHEGVSAREVESYASSAKQYGWIKAEYGKGYAPVGSICQILRRPQPGEEESLYFKAFCSPLIYKSIIESLGREKMTQQGVEIFLSREPHVFSDTGASLCAEVFILNAKNLGHLNEDGVFNISHVALSFPETTKKAAPNGPKKPPVKKEMKLAKTPSIEVKSAPPANTSIVKKITVFIKGQELHWPVLEGMNHEDWDHAIKQLQNIKSFSK